MPKPFQSKLITYEAEIAALLAMRPPTPYTRIAEFLRDQAMADFMSGMVKQLSKENRKKGGYGNVFRRGDQMRFRPGFAGERPLYTTIYIGKRNQT
jgi:hypothetical protein